MLIKEKGGLLVKGSLLLLLVFLTPSFVSSITINNGNILYVIPNNASYSFINDGLIINDGLKMFFGVKGGLVTINLSDDLRTVSFNSSVEQRISYSILYHGVKVLLRNNSTLFIDEIIVRPGGFVYELVIPEVNNSQEKNVILTNNQFFSSKKDGFFSKKLFLLIIPRVVFDGVKPLVVGEKVFVVRTYQLLLLFASLVIISWLIVRKKQGLMAS